MNLSSAVRIKLLGIATIVPRVPNQEPLLEEHGNDAMHETQSDIIAFINTIDINKIKANKAVRARGQESPKYYSVAELKDFARTMGIHIGTRKKPDLVAAILAKIESVKSAQ